MRTREIAYGRLRIAIGVMFLLTGIGKIIADVSAVSAIDSPAKLMSTSPAPVKYLINAGESKFIAHAYAGGLLWFKGHDHYLAAKEFTGQVELTPNTIVPASLRLVVKSDSLVETGKVFTEAQKEIINKEVREIVLHPDQYPEIVFQSTSVVVKATATGSYEVKITGDLTLHGVTRRIEIPARVTLNGDELRAVGQFGIDRGDYKVKATSAFHGFVRVRDKVKFEFDIVGRRG